MQRRITIGLGSRSVTIESRGCEKCDRGVDELILSDRQRVVRIEGEMADSLWAVLYDAVQPRIR